MNIKWLLEILLIAVCAVFVSACSRDAVSTEKPVASAKPAGETHPLRWMGHWKGEGRREEMVRQVLEAFSYTHPQIDVSFEFAADVLPEKSQMEMGLYIADMIRAGRMEWDVVWMDPLVYRTVATELSDWDWGRKHLVDFSEIEAVAGRQKPHLMTGPDAHKYTDGMMPGPYIEGFYYTVWYNRELAEQMGITVREKGMTPEDLLGYAEQIQAYNQRANKPVALLLDYEGAGSLRRLFISLLLSARSDIADPAGEDEAMARTLAVFEALAERFPEDCVLMREDLPEIAQSLIDGEALFFCDATWSYTTFDQCYPEGIKKLYLAQMPKFSDGVHEVIGGYISTWAVLKNAPGRDEGIELIKYWSRPEIAEQWVRDTKCPTGLAGSLYDPSFGNDVFAEYQRWLSDEGFCEASDPLMFQTELDERIDWELMYKVIADLEGESYLFTEGGAQ